MQLTDKDILEFQQLCKKRYRLELSWEDAQDQAIKLLRLMRVVYKPMTEEDFETIQQSNNEQDENVTPNEQRKPEAL